MKSVRLISPRLFRMQLAATPPIQGFHVHCLMVTPEAQFRGQDHRPFTVATEIPPSLCFSHSCLFAHISFAPPLVAVSFMPYPGIMFPRFSCFPSISVFATSTARNGRLILQKSPVADTAEFWAAFRLLFRANGQPMRRDIDVHVLCDSTFTIPELSSVS